MSCEEQAAGQLSPTLGPCQGAGGLTGDLSGLPNTEEAQLSSDSTPASQHLGVSHVDVTITRWVT